jgi:hypothetical protein
MTRRGGEERRRRRGEEKRRGGDDVERRESVEVTSFLCCFLTLSCVCVPGVPQAGGRRRRW